MANRKYLICTVGLFHLPMPGMKLHNPEEFTNVNDKHNMDGRAWKEPNLTADDQVPASSMTVSRCHH